MTLIFNFYFYFLKKCFLFLTHSQVQQNDQTISDESNVPGFCGNPANESTEQIVLEREAGPNQPNIGEELYHATVEIEDTAENISHRVTFWEYFI
jgi:hypothetical protein